jgi:hypothetical protein
MEGIYDIHCGGQVVGTAKVSREGLYYSFDCECKFKRQELFKICAICADKQIMLGTPIPAGQVFKLHTKLPIKRFSGETLRFCITGNQEEKSEEFIPVDPDAPFLHLKDLKNAVFRIQNGISGIVIRK